MNHWWRAYDEAVDEPKLLLLSEGMRWKWFCLMCVASANEGVLPDIKVVAVKLRVSAQKAAQVITELVLAGLLDRRADDRFEPHNWKGRQYKSDVTDSTNAERQKRYRNRHAVTEKTVTSTVTVTPPRDRVQNTEAETDSEREEPSLRSVVVRAETRTDFDEFWRVYPHKVGKQAAYKAFVKATKLKDLDLSRIMFALTAYVNKTDDRPWCNPATWLNEGRWDDQPAAENSRNAKPTGAKTVAGALDRLIAESEGADRTLDLGPADYTDRGFASGETVDGELFQPARARS